MINPHEKIMRTLKEGLEAYYKVLIGECAFEYLVLDLDCSRVPLMELSKKADAPLETKFFWDQLNANGKQIYKQPCLYYFEIVSPDNQMILNTYRDFRKNNAGRASAALKKYPPLDSNILYVGKVKQDIDSRMYIHLGYYYKGSTAGLQFAHWANSINLQLKLHIFAFDRGMKEFIDPLELPLARHLKPLIGKH